MILAAAILSPRVAAAHELSGYGALELRGFPQGERNFGASVAAQPEYRHGAFVFVPFGRLDQHDGRRTHFDVRELGWTRAAERWELRLGVRKVFWGVTESQHLVDIVNQTDLVENPDGEEKLGQPMANVALIGEAGTLDLFALAGFRKRSFPGEKGRLRPPFPMDQSAPGRVMDYAARFSRSAGPLDLGFSHFHGTSREPLPRYQTIHQSGLDAQATLGQWLLKIETIRRSGQGRAYTALTSGFEYTLGGKLGFIAEYLWDSRGKEALTLFEDDIMGGLRLTFEDAQSTELLLGAIADRDTAEKFLNLEASRRLGERWKATIEARAYQRVPGLETEDYVSLELARYF